MLRFLLTFFKSKTQLRLDNVFLRKQLEIVNRSNKKLLIQNRDRFFFILMKRFSSHWKESLVIIKPETVINWHRKGFKIYWTWKSKRKGRPRIDREIIQLIKQMANENQMWGIPRIHGEILKLWLNISESTVQRYLQKKNGRTSGQRWKTSFKIIRLKLFQ